ncbi:hypothetical protein Pla163_04660 [Planctomycetes bacterium Pla163]|uniref:HAMP domain-containing protein n=1 Tax=Rohdeia mirabilis TaxID=2528008 RepID=A0A518CVW2_9BACT|nr:hypothetical protein Pla163_04660 [Planctomycetes bacterium Pla163]
MKNSYKRRRFRLLRPGLQLRLMAAFGGIGLLALGLQFLLFYRAVGQASLALNSSDAAVIEDLTRSLIVGLAVSAGLLLPLVLAIGTSVVLRFVGPIYRFEVWIAQVLRGEDPGPCRLRRGDHLVELCALIDAVAAPMRASNAADPKTTLHEAPTPAALVRDPAENDEPSRRAA